ncbi:cell wall assembly protein Knr4, partial [Streptomyces sp. 12297]
LGLLVDQPFLTVRDEAAVNDLVYVNKCLRDHLTKDYLCVAFVQGGLLAVKVRGESAGSVWFCPYDDARDQDGWTVQERVERLLLPCGEDFDAFLERLAGNPPELDTVAGLMVDGGFARVVPVEG